MEVEFSESFTDRPAVAVDYQGMLPVDSQSNIHSPMRPGSTLLPYQPNAAAGSKASGRMGKSQHIAQIRSLGLLHDLQDYISSVECLASEQKKELERVREEKRDMEKVSSSVPQCSDLAHPNGSFAQASNGFPTSVMSFTGILLPLTSSALITSTSETQSNRSPKAAHALSKSTPM